MRHTLSGLVSRPVDAQQIIEELTGACACDRADISLLAGGAAGQVSSTLARGVQAGGQAAASAAGAMAQTLQGLFGALSRVASQPSSLFSSGGLTVAGDLASVISRSALNSVADLSQALVDFGVQEQLAHRYAQALRDGSILLIVRAHSDKMADCARAVLATHGIDGPAGAPGERTPYRQATR